MNGHRQETDKQKSVDFLGSMGGSRAKVPSVLTETPGITNGKWNKKARCIFDNLGVHDYTTEQEERLGSVLKALSSGMHPDRASKDLLELGNNAIVTQVFYLAVDCLFKFHSDSEITVDFLSYLGDRAKKGRKVLVDACTEMSAPESNIETLRLVLDSE